MLEAVFSVLKLSVKIRIRTFRSLSCTFYPLMKIRHLTTNVKHLTV